MFGKVVAFGEIMLRLNPPDYLRISQSKSFNVDIGGGEANVLVSLSNYGVPVEYVTRLPDNPLGDLCVQRLRQLGVSVSHVLRGGERLGLYFLERGAIQRPSKVVYDRSFSSISTVKPGMFDWNLIFKDAKWFHITGITPAISADAAAVSLEAVEAAHKMNITISCDLNYRKNLWKWGGNPREVLHGILKLCDYAIANEEDANSYFGILPPTAHLEKGLIEPGDYILVCEQLMDMFPNLKSTAITLRSSISASHNIWSGVAMANNQFYQGPVFDIDHIVDRIGTGDSFAAGFIYGIQAYPGDWQRALDFAISASCLKHSIVGDFNLVTTKEVEAIMSGETSGRVSR